MKLSEIYFKNYLLLGTGKITFKEGFNAVTGETGTGKSMLVGIINLLKGDKILWEKFNSDKPVEISGIFEFEGNELIVIRHIYPTKKRSRFFINDTPVTKERILKEIGNFIEISSQHEHSTLLKEELHIDYYDALIPILQERKNFQEVYDKMLKMRAFLENKRKALKELKEKEEFFKFKLKELESLNTYPNEEEELSEAIYRLENLEALKTAYQEGISIFYEGERNTYGLASSYLRKYEHVLSNNREASDILSLTESIMVNSEEIFSRLKILFENLEDSADTLEEKRKRLFELKEIMNKYGFTSTTELLLEIKNIRNALKQLRSEFLSTDEISEKLHYTKEEATSLAKTLHEQRKRALKGIEKSIKDEFKKLGFPKVNFKIDMENTSLSQKGIDRIKFYFSSTNKPPSLLKHVASGGELSRILLAFKALSAKHQPEKILIFDEIDSGIGGKTARTVGHRLKELSRYNQVIAITHLPQIASLADAHFVVNRKDTEKTLIQIKELKRQNRIFEIARMLSGENITDSAIKHAQTLMEDYKNDR